MKRIVALHSLARGDFYPAVATVADSDAFAFRSFTHTGRFNRYNAALEPAIREVPDALVISSDCISERSGTLAVKVATELGVPIYEYSDSNEIRMIPNTKEKII
jgi:hypothetical protein